MRFVSPTKGHMTLDEVAADIMRFREEGKDSPYQLIVGADSQPHAARQATLFVTAIVIHRVGKGARFFIAKRWHRKPLTFQHRIFMEAAMALEVVQTLEGALASLGNDLPIEIHLDIGEAGETKVWLKDIVGWVTQSGYQAKIKPESYGATKVADRYTKS